MHKQQYRAIKPQRRETNEVNTYTTAQAGCPKQLPAYRPGSGDPNKASGLTDLKRNSWNLGRQLELVGQSIGEWELFEERILEICKGVFCRL